MKRLSFVVALALVALAACGEDKGYGDPIDSPQGAQSATMAVDSTALLFDDSSNDSALLALNTMSAHINVLASAKLQAKYEDQYAESAYVLDESCVVVSGSTLEYNACDFNGMTVDGTVYAEAGKAEIDIDMAVDQPESDLSTELSIDGNIDASDTFIVGFLDFRTKIRTDGLSGSADLLSDYDVVLDNGCAVAGDIEVHAIARANGQSDDIWVKAVFGPSCGDVTIY